MERNKWLQVRVSDEERDHIRNLADRYGLDASTFIRAIVRFIDETEPQLVLTPMGKATEPN